MTDKQRRALAFTQKWCSTPFRGDPNDEWDVHIYLKDHLGMAKQACDDSKKSSASLICARDEIRAEREQYFKTTK